jgi:hypothetical protein
MRVSLGIGQFYGLFGFEGGVDEATVNVHPNLVW